MEICFEKPDGKLTSPLRYPWNSRTIDDLEPYLCNLCIAPAYRRRGLGRKLCQICEEIVLKEWKRDRIYLHVENKNLAAQSLYSKSGYNRLHYKLTPWEVKIYSLDQIMYYCKFLKLDSSLSSSTAFVSEVMSIPQTATDLDGSIGNCLAAK